MAKHNDNAVKQALFRKHKEEKLIDAVFVIHLTIALYILHNKFGFGEKRLSKFVKEFEEQLDCYNKGYVTLDDIKQSLKEDTGIEVLGR
jgi:hypothetical protein